MSAAAVIDLASVRSKKQQQQAAQAKKPAPVLWVPLFFWVPIYR
jgi:hypothetical protein